MEFSVLSTLPREDCLALRFGGTAMIAGDPSVLRRIEPGQEVSLGITRYITVRGGYTQAAYAFRSFLDEKGCRFPSDYDPPVHWNEIYDNPEWFLSTPGTPPQPRRTRPLTYTKDLILQEAQKAKDYSCESLYLDPGWDTAFGTFLWGEEWLGPGKEFVDRIRE